MTDNSNKIIEYMQSSFPHIYNVYDKNTILYALLSSYGERYGMHVDIIDRLYAMIGIDSTYDEDLEYRWGSLLSIHKNVGESYDDYRSRLKMVYSSLAGGTAEAIKYAIASVVGITTDYNIISKYIKVYDAWKYPYDTDDSIDKSYGHIICTVDLQANENVISNADKVMDAINRSKVSGIYPYLLFIYTMEEIGRLSYSDDTVDMLLDCNYDSIAILDTNESSNDIIYNDIDENTSLNASYGDMWGDGTNSMAVLNVNFATNIKAETDQCIDKIIYNK